MPRNLGCFWLGVWVSFVFSVFKRFVFDIHLPPTTKQEEWEYRIFPLCESQHLKTLLAGSLVLHGVPPNSSKQSQEEKTSLLLKDQRRKTIRLRKMRQQKGEREQRVKRQKREMCLPRIDLGYDWLSLRRDYALNLRKSTPRVRCKGSVCNKKYARFRNSVSAVRR